MSSESCARLAERCICASVSEDLFSTLKDAESLMVP